MNSTRTPATCHPGKAAYFKGKCKACYQRSRLEARVAYAPATCHPDRGSAYKSGLCRSCGQLNTPERRARNAKFSRDYLRRKRKALREGA